MDLPWTEYTRFTIALAAIIDPIAVVPFFLRVTADFTPSQRARAARLTGFAVAGVLGITSISGEAILSLMGTSLAAFRVGGGIVLLLMAISMLAGTTTSDGARTPASNDPASVAMVPLGIPLLAGPGAISTSIIQMQRGDGFLHGLLVLLAIAVVAASCWWVLHHAERVGKAIGAVGLDVVVRLFGLILAAIAVEMMANGLRGLFPVLAG